MQRPLSDVTPLFNPVSLLPSGPSPFDTIWLEACVEVWFSDPTSEAFIPSFDSQLCSYLIADLNV